MGHLGRPRIGRRHARRGPRRQGRHRARLRHRRTCRPGWPGAVRESWASTTPRRSSPPHGGSCSRHGLDFPLLHGNAETVPYPDASFDFAISEYGAMPVGRSGEMGAGSRAAAASGWTTACFSPTRSADALHAGRGRRRRDGTSCSARRSACTGSSGPDDPGVEFHLSHGDWIRLLRASGFEIEELVEMCPPARRDNALPVRHARVGAADGRAKRCGRRGRRSRRGVGGRRRILQDQP